MKQHAYAYHDGDDWQFVLIGPRLGEAFDVKVEHPSAEAMVYAMQSLGFALSALDKDADGTTVYWFVR